MCKFLILFIIIALATASCSKKNSTDNAALLKGKVIRITCASYVVEVLNTDTIGVDGWVDRMNNSKVYNNVFGVSNKCIIPAGIGKDNIITFRIAESSNDNCSYCDLYDAPPSVLYPVKDVKLEN
ncbi:MAG: hypothetical protein QM731_09990 [Chitinophagaceae bacterium]